MIELFLELLAQATARIPADYFQLPTVGEDEGIYRERVYCYELYHQLRTLLENEPRLAGYALSGEINKQGHAIIRPCVPDFVFHIPGRMENLVVVEVKPVVGALDGIQKDLETLAYFVAPPVNYQCAVHLVYGDDARAFARFENLFRTAGLPNGQLFWHQRSAERAIRTLPA